MDLLASVFLADKMLAAQALLTFENKRVGQKDAEP
jgi:hypothetical protein